jgi:hypothetical protein
MGSFTELLLIAVLVLFVNYLMNKTYNYCINTKSKSLVILTERKQLLCRKKLLDEIEYQSRIKDNETINNELVIKLANLKLRNDTY